MAFWSRFWRTRKDEQASNQPDPTNGQIDTAGLGGDRGLVERVDAKERWDASEHRSGDRRRYLLYGTRREPLPSYLGTIEDPVPGKVGICCSGGGIRSAAYNLGALQALQEEKELERATYLAAVSGGSYIAAAFAMVAKSWAPGSRPEGEKKGYDDSNPDLLKECPPFARGSPEEQYLRNRSSYLAPDGMGKLYLAFRVVLGLLLNLFIVSLPLFSAALILGQVLYRPVFGQLVGDCQDKAAHGCAAATPEGLWIVPLVIVGVAVVAGVVGMLARFDDRDTRLFEVWPTRLLLFGAGIALFFVVVPVLVDAFHASAATTTEGAPKPETGVGVASVGLVGLVAGLLAQLRDAMATPQRAVKSLNAAQKAFRGLSAKSRLALAYFAGAVIGPLFLFAAVVFGVSVALASSEYGSSWWDGMNWWVVGGGAVGLAGFGAIYLIADITSWSLHPIYKRRLCTAFALKRVRASDLRDEEKDRAEAVPGQDGVALERNYDKLVDLSHTALDGTDSNWPTLLVCAAANISDPGATPPGRGVTSFTFSPHSIGGPLVGGAPTGEFEKAFDHKLGSKDGENGCESDVTDEPDKSDKPPVRRDFSLPAAVAVSGAALSPSMGKMTRRPLTFLLALANVRLGVWMPNPRWIRGKKGKVSYHRKPRPVYLLRELLGRNRVDDRYLYVTDGGHYENLGLVELMRRGCTEIYCFDASGGEAFDVLGDAVALARSELGVEIDIDPSHLFPGEDGTAKADTVRAGFTYHNVHSGEVLAEGTLIYARNVMTDGVPWDVKAHHKVDPRFPHNSTADQLYTDQKFEGYRVLGDLAGSHAVELMRDAR